MLVPILIISIVILGVIVVYLYYLAPRLNPKNKAENLLNENRVDEAIIEYKKVLEKSPYDVSTHWRLSGLYMNQSKFDLTINHLEAIIDINRYNADVEKSDVYKLLADLYLQRGDRLRAFGRFYDLLKEYPSDAEALYHVGFISLGQEVFETAFKHLETLSRMKKKNFEILFGAGISAFQSQRTQEAITFFKEALTLQPDSDICSIALSFAFYRKRDYKAALDSVRKTAENSRDDNAQFIVKRLMAFINVELKKYATALRLFDELKDYCESNGYTDELKVALYDFGFASLLDDRKEDAYMSWNQLYQMERNFRNVLDLITRLRKEMDIRPGSKPDDSKPVVVEAEGWKEKAFPEKFVWNICGLKSSEELDIQPIIAAGRSSGTREKKYVEEAEKGRETVADLDDLFNLDAENFRSVSYRICEKLGFVVDEILNTYRESDGVDFLATQKEGKLKTLIWVRRWKGANIGEIPLRNFAQAINDAKCRQGFFITASPLSPAGESALKGLDKVNVIFPEELSSLLKGLV